MTAKKTNTKSAQIENEKNQATQKKASGITVDSALNTLSTAQAAISKTLANVGEQIQSQLQELSTVQKAVELEKQELTNLHDIHFLTKSTEDIEALCEVRKEDAKNSFKAFEAELNDRRAEIQRNHAQFTATSVAEQSRSRSEYEYQFEQSKKVSTDRLNEEFRVLRAQERDRKEGLEKVWTAREEELKKNETLFSDLQKQVAEFPQTLKAEVEKATAIVGSSVKRDYTHQIEMFKKDAEVAQRMAQSTIETLNSRIANDQKIIEALTIRLTAADQRVENIATKAMDAASGRQALAEMASFAGGNNNGAPGRKSQ